MSNKNRVFTGEFKEGVAQRIVNGESVTALYLETQIKRSVLYRWRDAYRKDGAAGLQRPAGRPPGVPNPPRPVAGPQRVKPGTAPNYPVAESPKKCVIRHCPWFLLVSPPWFLRCREPKEMCNSALSLVSVPWFRFSALSLVSVLVSVSCTGF